MNRKVGTRVQRDQSPARAQSCKLHMQSSIPELPLPALISKSNPDPTRTLMFVKQMLQCLTLKHVSAVGYL